MLDNPLTINQGSGNNGGSRLHTLQRTSAIGCANEEAFSPKTIGRTIQGRITQITACHGFTTPFSSPKAAVCWPFFTHLHEFIQIFKSLNRFGTRMESRSDRSGSP
jgi:hypothetical protein